MKSLPDVAADGLLNAAFAVSRFYCLYWSELLLLPPTNEEVNVFARVRLSVCLSVSKINQKRVHAWLYMKCCVSTDVGTWTN